jgi:hypothetical protein
MKLENEIDDFKEIVLKGLYLDRILDERYLYI